MTDSFDPLVPPPASLDFSSLDFGAGAEGGKLALEHPVTGEALGTVITLAGIDSKLYRQAQREIANRRLKGRRKKTLEMEDFENDNLELLARCTLEWNTVLLDGAELPCTRENARKFYDRFPWVREQVEAYVNDRNNFLRD